MLFYALLVILALFALQVTSADLVNGALNGYVKKELGVTLDKNSNLHSSLLWFLLFGVSTKYYQTVILIERQYDYIHYLEEIINGKYYIDSRVFTREGKAYLNKYPMFSNWTCFLYTVAFPLLVLLCITVRILGEFSKIEALGLLGLAPSFVCYLLVDISTILYLVKLHENLLLRTKKS